MKKLAFISTRNGYQGEDGILYFDKANGRLINQLLQKYPDMLVVAYGATTNKAVYNEPIATDNILLMPETRSYFQGFRNTPAVSKLLVQLNAEYDAFIFQLPFHAFCAMRKHRKPTVFHLCANVVTAAKNPVKYKGWRRVVSQTIAWMLDWTFRAQFRRAGNLVVTNGDELAALYNEFSPTATVSSSIFESELVPQIIKTKPNSPFRIIFVGRPTLEKGVDLLIRAFQMLRQEGVDVHLTCVGFTEEEFLQANHHLGLVSAEEGLSGVTFAGVIPFGDALFAAYAEADALILPSRNEGTPRVLIEARSQGCPVIATRVGGIPTSIRDGIDGILVAPESAEAIASGVKRLMLDEDFWHQLAVEGLKKVRDGFTVEKFSAVFEEKVDKLLANHE